MKRREWAIAGALVLAMLGCAGFVTAYALAILWFEGVALAAGLLGFALAALGWAFWILPADRVVDERDTVPSSAAEREGAIGEAVAGERQVARPVALAALLAASLGVLAIALLAPLRSLGPLAGTAVSKWRRGTRLVREDGSAVLVADLNVDSEVTVFPEGAIGDAMSQAALIRLPDGLGASVDGYIAYSKVCTHAGCPVALYRAAKRQLLCPCHQSVFDVLDNGKVLSGPADHALPHLPLAVDASGYLIADGDFSGKVGPASW